MTFIVGRDFAERQILKKWKWTYLLNWVEYFDKLLRKHWYWQDLAQEIAKWHFSLVEALPSSKFWKSDNGAIPWARPCQYQYLRNSLSKYSTQFKR